MNVLCCMSVCIYIAYTVKSFNNHTKHFLADHVEQTDTTSVNSGCMCSTGSSLTNQEPMHVTISITITRINCWTTTTHLAYVICTTQWQSLVPVTIPSCSIHWNSTCQIHSRTHSHVRHLWKRLFAERMRFQEEFQYITKQNSTAVYTNVNKWKHRDITRHARRGSKWKLFTAGKLDKIGDAFHILLKTSWSILQTTLWFWRCHKIDDTCHTTQQ